MIKAINMKTFENVRDGLKNGAESAMERTRRVEFRKPWIYRKPPASILGFRPWLLGIMVFSSLAAILVGVLYSRKRKQVTDRYSTSDSGEPDSLNGHQIIRDEQMAPTTP